MKPQLQSWVGQITTGHGMMILGPTLMAIASGTMTLHTGLPLLVAGVVGLLWPENVALRNAAQTISVDADTLFTAIRSGLRPAGTTDHAPVSTVGPQGPLPPSPTVTGLAMLAASAIALSA